MNESDKLIQIIQNNNNQKEKILNYCLSTVNENKQNWIDKFIDLYRKISTFFINDTYRELKAVNVDRDVEKYINYFAGKRITLISDTTKEEIKKIILENLKSGAGVAKIEYDIRHSYNGFSKSRAETIARTEVSSISNYAMLQGAMKINDDYLYKIWIPILDSKTRDTHSFMVNHKPVKLDEPFKVGDTKMMFPGDPTAPAKEVIRCRCSLKFEKIVKE